MKVSIFEAFNAMYKGGIAEDRAGIWFKKEGNQLVESLDCGKSWQETNQLHFGSVNDWWKIVQ